jgi:hypothetical protein
LGISKVEYGVVVGHERIPENPELATKVSITDNAANAFGRAFLEGTKVEAVGHREIFAGNGERDFGECGVARDCVEAVTDGLASRFSTGDLGIEGVDGLGVTDDKSGSLSKRNDQ